MYGEATAEEVLGAKVPPPTEFAGLMDMLNRLTEAAMPKPAFHRTRSNASQSALEKAARARLASSSNKSMDTGSIEPSSL